ncbi:MAG: type IV conjugative transfer system lipoprotein TraV [Pseudomonadales bacterium]
MAKPLRPTILALALIVAGLQGCATVGSGDFACPGRPTGVRCASAVEVYALTEGTDMIDATSEGALGDDPKKAVKARKKQKERVAEHDKEEDAKPVDVREKSPQTPVPEMQRGKNDGQLLQASTGGSPVVPLVNKPIPVRTPAQVMRVWVAPWEDAKGILHVGGYHFVEIQARRWTFGGQGQVQPVRLFSIQEPYPDTANAGGDIPPSAPKTAKVSTKKKSKSQ